MALDDCAVMRKLRRLISTFSSFEKVSFSIDAFALCCHKVISLIAITVLYTCVDCTGYFLACYDKKESVESFLTGKGLSHILFKIKDVFT